MDALLNKEEIALAHHCLAYALEQGASAVRITLSKSLMNLTGVLNGEVDKVAHALDRSLQLQAGIMRVSAKEDEVLLLENETVKKKVKTGSVSSAGAGAS